MVFILASYKGGLGSRRCLKYGLKTGGDPSRKEPSKVIKYNLDNILLPKKQSDIYHNK